MAMCGSAVIGVVVLLLTLLGVQSQMEAADKCQKRMDAYLAKYNVTSSCRCLPLRSLACDNFEDVFAFTNASLPRNVSLPTSSAAPFENLYLDRRNLVWIPSRKLALLPIRRIWLTGNRLPNRYNFSHDAFRGSAIENALEELYLGACQLKELRKELVSGLRRLRELHLWDNQLNSFPSGFFNDLPALRVLVAWGNRFEQLHAGMFSALSALRRLDLDRNNIGMLDSEPFRNLDNLEVLSLAGNRIGSLDSGVFTHVPKLRILKLDHNIITAVSPQAFAGLSELTVLALEHNRLRQLPDRVFTGLKKVEIIRLHDNVIEQVTRATFGERLPALLELDLSRNRLSAVPSAAFKHCTKLKRLLLDGNKLTALRKCTIHQHDHLSILSLSDNPLACDCPTAWVAEQRAVRGLVAPGTCTSSRPSTAPWGAGGPSYVAPSHASHGAAVTLLEAPTTYSDEGGEQLRNVGTASSYPQCKREAMEC